MILDTIANAEKYSVIDPRITKGLNFIIRQGSAIDEGKHHLEGDDLYVIIVDAELRSAENAPLEAHRQYIDVQVVLQGAESYGWSTLSNCHTAREEFDPQKDIIFFEEHPTATIRATEGQFLIFFPEDCHAPLIGKGRVRKAIIKIKVENPQNQESV